MRALIAITLGIVAALFATGIEERAMGYASGWLALIVGVSVFVIVIHRLALQARKD
jgi:uncharacterized membrane protein